MKTIDILLDFMAWLDYEGYYEHDNPKELVDRFINEKPLSLFLDCYQKVSVKDELPSEKGDYFVIDKVGDIYSDTWQGEVFFHDQPFNDITHWLKKL